MRIFLHRTSILLTLAALFVFAPIAAPQDLSYATSLSTDYRNLCGSTSFDRNDMGFWHGFFKDFRILSPGEGIKTGIRAGFAEMFQEWMDKRAERKEQKKSLEESDANTPASQSPTRRKDTSPPPPKEKKMSKCRYCNSTSYGSGCTHSPHKKHEHVDDEKKCEFCGSSSYGSGCSHSPTRKHRHGHGGNKCVWCGSSSSGSGCSHSPSRTHEK